MNPSLSAACLGLLEGNYVNPNIQLSGYEGNKKWYRAHALFRPNGGNRPSDSASQRTVKEK